MRPDRRGRGRSDEHDQAWPFWLFSALPCSKFAVMSLTFVPPKRCAHATACTHVKAATQRACATQLEVKALIGRQEASSRVWAELRRACVCMDEVVERISAVR